MKKFILILAAVAMCSSFSALAGDAFEVIGKTCIARDDNGKQIKVMFGADAVDVKVGGKDIYSWSGFGHNQIKKLFQKPTGVRFMNFEVDGSTVDVIYGEAQGDDTFTAGLNLVLHVNDDPFKDTDDVRKIQVREALCRPTKASDRRGLLGGF